MKSLNRWAGIGRLGQDPETRTTPNGQIVCNISIACQDDYKDQSGNKVERTDWVSLVIWGQQAETFCKYTRKGSNIYAEGKLSTRKFQDKNGNDQYRTDIVVSGYQFLDGKSDSRPASAAPSQPTHKAEEPAFDDDIPF
jgi:single-strand DNA-binding protein